MKYPNCNTENIDSNKTLSNLTPHPSPPSSTTTIIYNPLNVKEEYLKAYMGPKYETLKTQKFSLWAFLFNTYYFLYLKMWIWAFALFIISKILYSIFSIIFSVILALNFNSIYTNYATNEIIKIINKNPNASDEKIIELCQKRGNTNIVLPIILIILQILAFLIEIYIFTHKNIF